MKILALGDSLTAGFMLDAKDAFPAQLERALKAKGVDVRVINAGVSGDTSAAGRARLAWALGENPHAAIVELGANDGLRALDPERTFQNLDAIVETLKGKGIPVLLAGMYAPPNLGKEYGGEFREVYSRLVAKHDLIFYPFFLEGVTGRSDLLLQDGMHPNAKGVAVIVENILPSVTKLIDRASARLADR